MNAKKNYLSLSEPQKMIYWGEQMYPNSSLNTLCATYRLGNQNNRDVMETAIKAVINENPGLHIRIHQIEGIPYQYRCDNSSCIEYKDFSNEEGLKTESDWISSMACYKFNLFDNRLFRFCIYHSFDSTLNLLILTHHIVSDAWSHQSLAWQIKEKYRLIEGNRTQVFNNRYCYLDYLETEREYLNSPRYSKAIDFWKEKFNSVESLTRVLTVNNRKRDSKSKRYKLFFDTYIQEKIINICEQNSISYPTFFLSCLYITLNVLKPNRDNLIGTLSYNRIGSREKEGVGMFVNTLPLYLKKIEEMNFKGVKDRVDSELKGVMRHQRFPLGHLTNIPEIKSLNIAENIEVIYSYQNIEMPYNYTYQYNKSSSYPILFRPNRSEDSGEFFIDIDYQTIHFNRQEIENISNTFLHVVDSIDSNIHKDLIYDKGKFQIERSRSQKKYNLNQTLHGIFEEKVEQIPDQIAVTFRNDDLTYRELNSRANYLAKEFISNSGGFEKPIIVIVDRSLNMMIALLAILKSGNCYLPLSPELPQKRIESIVKLSGSNLVLSDRVIRFDIEDSIEVLDLKKIHYPKKTVKNINLNVKANNLAYIIYTSGSTGEPKGVMLEHMAVVNRLLWMQDEFNIDSEDRLIQKTPFTFDVSVWELFWWYFNGSSLHFLEPGGEKDPEQIIKSIYNNSITVIHFVPSMLSIFLDYLERGGSREKVKSLKYIICSGEPLRVSSVQKIKRLLGDLYGTLIYNLYGPTEAAIDVTYYKCSGLEREFVPIGYPIDNVELYILNERGEVLPYGVSGELNISGVCLSRGYFNKEELTLENFKYHKDLGKVLYKTGDIAQYLDSGLIKYIGRVDSQVKIRGNRVELGEIERSILEYGGVDEVSVIAPVDSCGNTYIGAYFVSKRDVLHQDLRHYLQNILPSYMIPSYFLQLDKFPLTNSGKVDKKQLPDFNNPAGRGKVFLAPVNDREEEICEIWEDLLSVEKVSRQDNFFDLGGDSLSLIKVHFRLQERYDISLQDLFEYQTIEQLSPHLKERVSRGLSFNVDEYSSLQYQRSTAEKIRKYYGSLKKIEPVEKVSFNKVFITGGTGYMGSYIVREYLENTESDLYILVRADDYSSAEERIYNKLNFYFGLGLWEKYSDRINVVLGDLTSRFIGLSDTLYESLAREISLIIHCAANVKHFASRSSVNSINVIGTEAVLEFAEHINLKKVIYISTMSIGLTSIEGRNAFHFIESDTVDLSEDGNVYIDSKILAEKLVKSYMERGKAQIVRVGNLFCDSINGQFQENSGDNGFLSLLKEYRKRGCVPSIDIPFIDLTYVNEAANALRLLVESSLCGTYHLYNSNSISLVDLANGLDLGVKPIREFISNIKPGDSILNHGYYLERINMLNLITYNEYTQEVLKQLNFSWSPINFEIIDNLITI